MNELDKYLHTYDPDDIPFEDVRKDVIEQSALFTQAFFEHLRHSMVVNFNYAISYEKTVQWNGKDIKIETSYIQEISPNVLNEVKHGSKELLFPLFDYIIKTLNDESNKRHGKYRFFIQGIHVSPVITNKDGAYVAGIFLKYIPIQVSW